MHIQSHPSPIIYIILFPLITVQQLKLLHSCSPFAETASAWPVWHFRTGWIHTTGARCDLVRTGATQHIV